MIITKTREQLTQGLIQGESIQKMGKRIKDIYEGDTQKALRIAQTETNRVRNAGKEAGYQRAAAKGIMFKKVWVSALDSRTRDTHKKLDGMAANKDGYFVLGRFKALHPGGFGVAEMDINCRCTTRAELQGFEPSVRRAKGEGIIDYASYEDWQKERVSG
jgi:SPP1 gp7 family putative phage head morphogenesis protein